MGTSVSLAMDFTQGAIQKLRGQDFDHFWQPTYLNVDIFYPNRGQKETFFDHLPTSSCPRSFWMNPLDIDFSMQTNIHFFVGKNVNVSSWQTNFICLISEIQIFCLCLNFTFIRNNYIYQVA